MSSHPLKVTGWSVLSRRWVWFLTGALLSFAAGTVNGVTTASVVFERTTHVSGRVNDVLRDLIFDRPEGLLVLCVIASFLVGAFIAGRLVPRRGPVFTLVTVVILVLSGAGLVWGIAVPGDKAAYLISRYLVAFVLALSSGLQNGTTSQLVLGRTTHYTGDLTDMGIAIAAAEWVRVRYLLVKMVTFTVGGLAGFLGTTRSHPSYALLLSAAVVILTVLGLEWLERRSSGRPGESRQ